MNKKMHRGQNTCVIVFIPARKFVYGSCFIPTGKDKKHQSDKIILLIE